MKDKLHNIQNLALKRTKLAIERTTSSHIRTSFAAIVFGIGIYNFFTTKEAILLVVIFLIFGFGEFIFAVLSYYRRIKNVEENLLN